MRVSEVDGAMSGTYERLSYQVSLSHIRRKERPHSPRIFAVIPKLYSFLWG
jgi:hypothetical protein